MNDSRSNPRTHVAWRGAVQISKDKIIGVKVVDFSATGAQIMCSISLEEKKIYQIMIEIPTQRNPTIKIQLVCKAKVIYSILSGSEYRIGLKLSEIPATHHKLIQHHLSV
jgi:hypothetical protein